MIAVLKKRRALRDHYLQLAREYVQSLESELSITLATVKKESYRSCNS
jgi:hypothetical protein